MIFMAITFDTNTIRLITIFENFTGAPVKDCLVDEASNTVYFVVEEGKVGIAIGKNGNSVKNAEQMIGRSIKLFEFSNDVCLFVKKMIPQAKDVKIRNEDERVIVEVSVDKIDKALVIGREGRNKTVFKEILKRNHDVDELIIR